MRKLLTGVILGLLLAVCPAVAQLGPQPGITVNNQTGTSYTVLNSDCGKIVSTTNAAAIAVTLPQAGSNSNFVPGCTIYFSNNGAGNATITPTTSTIGGRSSFVLQQGGGIGVTSFGGNWTPTVGFPAVIATGGLIDGDQVTTATASITGVVKIGKCLEGTGSGNKVLDVSAVCRTRTYGVAFGDGTNEPSTGILGGVYVDQACTINAYQLFASKFTSGSTGSAVVDIWVRASGSFPPTVSQTITASAKPTLSSAASSFSTTLTGWTTSVAAGSVVFFNLDSVSTITQGTIQFSCIGT